jgi:hypothetical protein
MTAALGAVEGLVALAVVLTGKALTTARPFADERTFLCVAAEVTAKVKATREGAATAWNRALELSVVAATAGAGSLGCSGSHVLLLDLENGRKTGDSTSSKRV